MRWLPILLALAATHVVADTDNGQAVFDVGHEATSQPIDATEVRPKRVAIIGAGASGAAAALFMSRAAREAEQQRGMKKGELLGDLVVYEQNDYVGGRSTVVYPHGDKKLPHVELGASIFVAANKHLVDAAKRYNLTMANPGFAEDGTGIWDGSVFLFQTSAEKSRTAGWWDTIAALRRYGPLSPWYQKRNVDKLKAKFANLYDSSWVAARGVVKSVAEFADSAGLGMTYTSRTGEDWALNEVGVNVRWMSEIMEGTTRVNYAQDMIEIHALGAAVGLAAGGAASVAEGNYKLFEGMIKESGAELRLNTVVEEIKLDARRGLAVITNSSEDAYDQVFFAAPWHSSPVNKDLESHFDTPIPRQDYVNLHVTLLTTTARTPSAEYFGLPEDAPVPTTILTTNYYHRTARTPAPQFNSLTYHSETYPGSGEWVVKLFSREKLSNDDLEEIFGSTPTWVYRKVWQSYPELRPGPTYAPVAPVKGLEYLAAQEAWVSTMETQTISAREAVARVVNDWWDLNPGECGKTSWDYTCTVPDGT